MGGGRTVKGGRSRRERGEGRVGTEDKDGDKRDKKTKVKLYFPTSGTKARIV